MVHGLRGRKQDFYCQLHFDETCISSVRKRLIGPALVLALQYRFALESSLRNCLAAEMTPHGRLSHGLSVRAEKKGQATATLTAVFPMMRLKCAVTDRIFRRLRQLAQHVTGGACPMAEVGQGKTTFREYFSCRLQSLALDMSAL